MSRKCLHCGHALPKTDYALVLMIVLPIIFATFSGTKYYPDANSDSVIVVQKSYWGIRKEERMLKYFRAPGYDYAAWNIRNSQGEWYPFIVDD